MLKKLSERLRSLCIFREMLSDPVIAALCRFLYADDDGVADYCEFVNKLYQTGSTDFSKYVAELTRCCPNPLVSVIGEGKKAPEAMILSARYELKIIEALAQVTPKLLREQLDYDFDLPEWSCSTVSITEDFKEQIQNISKHGYGIYAKYRAFYRSNGEIVPVKAADTVRLDELAGYRREKELILNNIRALLDGKPAANMLLTGDAGTGKSSTIKAAVNELWGEGLRILELKKAELRFLPEILSELNRNPLKFIIFIDDLSFTDNDDNFSALKAALEGSVSAKAKNVIIAATGNRRHLVKETFSDREGDDIHRTDSMQEIISLSERFGLHITFSKPDKQTYFEIVRHLCEECGIEYNAEVIEAEAEKFALQRSGRSARAAKQFVDSLCAEK